MTQPVFPPLFTGLGADGANPFALACAQAKAVCDAGLVTYDLAHDRLRAAIVFAPEVPLRQAACMLPLCGLGFQNALGALAPPEVAVHLGWDGGIYVNGGRCGALTIAASRHDPDAVPDWLVVGLSLDLWPPSDDTGHTPDATALYAEGCGDVDAVTLLEAWVRHTLVALNDWAEDGPARLHASWLGVAHGRDTEVAVAGQRGTFVGLDENLGLLLKSGDQSRLIPLTALLTEPT
ncbi:biotin/lipoate--protein ligase family protein [uncultured Aliiroseovarius sp.]|uniref:biotin/lipoate--protein ligase family protein n=1 Tax=uncultured Aliiroseovarius sp. TaxID=1658783 RepID=UPI00259A43AF|nr:biotin/lipoate--protein ligase family protein [uncultured Aliiroseovarius sp.]